MSDTLNRTRFAALALALGTLASSGLAQAQCDAGDDSGVDPSLEGSLRDSFPADQGVDVPLNSPIRLRYYGRVPDPPVVCVQRESLDAPAEEEKLPEGQPAQDETDSAPVKPENVPAGQATQVVAPAVSW